MMIAMADTLLSLAEIAKGLGVSVRTVKRYIALGRIEAIMIGNRYKVRQSAFDRYLAKHTKPENP
jgi:excisionase family DNA binding protein